MPIYNKSPLGLLCDEINARQTPKLPLSPTNVRVRKVEAITARDITKPNAKVTLVGRQSHGITGELTVLVRRIALATLFKNLKPIVIASRNITFAEAARLLNVQYGLNLDPADFRDDIYTGRPNFNLTPGANSLQYYGSVTIKIVDMIKDLGYLRSLQIDERKHPVAVDGRKCIDMLSWGWDNTDIRSYITAIPAGKLSNTTAVSSLLSELKDARGITINVTGATIRHYNPISGLATANMIYDRVSVISGIDDPNYAGTMYLHFNV